MDTTIRRDLHAVLAYFIGRPVMMKDIYEALGVPRATYEGARGWRATGKDRSPAALQAIAEYFEGVEDYRGQPVSGARLLGFLQREFPTDDNGPAPNSRIRRPRPQ